MLKSLVAPLWKLLLGAFLLIVLTGTALRWWDSRQTQQATQNCQGVTVVVNDSTQAVCTRLKADRTELLSLRAAATAMGGSAVAGVQIRIKTDTLWLPPREVPTDTLPNQSRVATLTDTTQDYRVTITATAPTYPANLQIGYEIVTPERTAEIGFVKTKNGYYAVVSGRGITATQSFFTPERERPLALYTGVGISGKPLLGADGADIRPNVFLSLQYRTAAWQSSLDAGVDSRAYIGLRIQRKLF